MVEKARALYEELRAGWMVEYDDGGAIGRRYRRQDEIGTPFAFTIDEQTLADDTVTIRERDSLAQDRLAIGQVAVAARGRAPHATGARRRRTELAHAAEEVVERRAEDDLEDVPDHEAGDPALLGVVERLVEAGPERAARSSAGPSGRASSPPRGRTRGRAPRASCAACTPRRSAR